MRKSLKRALSVLIAATMLFAVCAFASAAEELPTAAIQVNGEIITEYPSGVAPYYDKEQGRIYMPYRDLLTLLGAVVSYDEEKGAAVAVRDDLTVTYVLGADSFTVKTGDAERVITSDVKPININDHILVPARFISESIGARVAWDGANGTALIVDPYLIIKDNTDTYEIFDKLYGLAAATDKNTESHADIAVDFSVKDADGTLALPATATVDVVASAAAVDAKINVKADLTSILGALPGLSAEINLDADLIVNAQTGIVSLQSDGLYALAESLLGVKLGLEPGTWVKLDPAELLEATGVAAADAVETVALDNTKDIVDYMTAVLVQSMPLESIYDYAVIADALALGTGLYADKSFVKTGNDYVSTVKFDEEGLAASFVLTLKADAAGKATGFALDFDIKGDAGEVAKLSLSTDGKDIALSFTYSADGAELSFRLDLTTKTTDKAPRTEAPKDATVVDLGGLI
jgi:hypothetical protein